MRCILAIALLGLVAASCATPSGTPEPAGWSLTNATFFPSDRSLTHPEDGVMLSDGSLLVGDWDHGLVQLSSDGTTRPFGSFAAAGFKTKPAPDWGSPNGVSLEPDGRHVLVADITGGAIYRVDTATEKVVRIYDHPFGVNAVVRDSSGAIWFTQSTENAAGAGSEARMFAAVDGLGDGAVFRIAPDQIGQASPVAERKLSGLDFANGIAIDERRGQLYVAEIIAHRILALPVDVRTGKLGAQRVLTEIVTPDNIELDSDGDLWVASPLGNEILVVDPDTGRSRSMFRPTPEASAILIAEMRRRQKAGLTILPLLGPQTYGPMPGLLTGIILSPGEGPVYVSGLGQALVKLDRQAEGRKSN